MHTGIALKLPLILAALIGGISVHAADHTVTTTSAFTFSPAVVNAHPGDRVIFNVDFAQHPTRSGPANMCTADGVYFSYTSGTQKIFVIPGENFPPQIPFNCAVHCGGGMRGVINITPISPSGACCTDFVCAVMTVDECKTAGGAFLGADSGCMGDAENPISCCPANFNQTNAVTVQDIFDYLTAWLAGSATADFNHANGVTVQDIFDYLTAWLAGC